MDLYSQEIQEKKKDLQNHPQTIKKMAIGTYISIITLNLNGLNAPTKRYRLTEWIQKPEKDATKKRKLQANITDEHRCKNP